MKAALLALGIAASVVPSSQTSVGLLVPPFDGPELLGQRTATVLNLQVWQTLRKSDGKKSFGDATVYWEPNGRSAKSHADAESMRFEDVRAVLWGKAWRYGDGVVVQAHLSIPRTDETAQSNQIWRISTLVLGRTLDIAVNLPEWRFEFAPIVLKPEVVQDLSTPTGLKLYRTPSSQEVVGYVGNSFTALEQGPDFAKVRSDDGHLGYVRLPSLSKNRNEVVDFTGGVIRVFRNDWAGAIRLLGRVVNNSKAPTPIKIDALLMMGAASENLGQSGSEYVLQAYNLNPFLQSTARYKCMMHLSDLKRSGANQVKAQEAVKALRRTIAESKSLFPGDDSWLTKLRSAID